MSPYNHDINKDLVEWMKAIPAIHREVSSGTTPSLKDFYLGREFSGTQAHLDMDVSAAASDYNYVVVDQDAVDQVAMEVQAGASPVIAESYRIWKEAMGGDQVKSIQVALEYVELESIPFDSDDF